MSRLSIDSYSNGSQESPASRTNLPTSPSSPGTPNHLPYLNPLVPTHKSVPRIDAIHYTCAQCGKEEDKEHCLRRCGKCKSIEYCSKECQLNHWSIHKLTCEAAEDTRSSIERMLREESDEYETAVINLLREVSIHSKEVPIHSNEDNLLSCINHMIYLSQSHSLDKEDNCTSFQAVEESQLLRLVDSGAVDAIIEAMHTYPNSIPINQAAISFLRLGRCVQIDLLLQSKLAPERVLNAIDKHSDNLIIVRDTCAILEVFLRTDKGSVIQKNLRKKLIKKDILMTVLKCLKKHLAEADVVYYALNVAVSLLCYDYKTIEIDCSAIVNTLVVIAQIYDDRDDKYFLTAIYASISNMMRIIFKRSSGRDLVLKDKPLRAVFKAIRFGIKSKECHISYLGCMALCAFADNESSCNILLITDITIVVVNVLEEFFHDKNIIEKGLHIYSRLMNASPLKCSIEIIKARGMKWIANSANTYSQSENICIHSVYLFGLIAKVVVPFTSAHRLGALPINVCFNIIKNHPANPTVLKKALASLLNILSVRCYRESIGESSYLCDILVELLRSNIEKSEIIIDTLIVMQMLTSVPFSSSMDTSDSVDNQTDRVYCPSKLVTAGIGKATAMVLQRYTSNEKVLKQCLLVVENLACNNSPQDSLVYLIDSGLDELVVESMRFHSNSIDIMLSGSVFIKKLHDAGIVINR